MRRVFVSTVMVLFLLQWMDGSLGPISDNSIEAPVKSDFLAIELSRPPSPKDFTFDMSTKAQFLLAHNGMRSRVTPPASNMLFMLWKGELEYLAEQWVDKCQWGRDPALNIHDFDFRYSSAPDRIGQNIYAMDDNVMRNLSLKARDVVGEWASERNSYYYNSPTRYCTYDICGNYSQIVWAETMYLGCASKVCSRLNGSGLTAPAQLIVCNYSPGGNIKGTRPYGIGQPCSKCPAGFQHCVENLCEAFPRCQPVTECTPVNDTTCLCEHYPIFGASVENNGCIIQSSYLSIFLVLLVTIFTATSNPVLPKNSLNMMY